MGDKVTLSLNRETLRRARAEAEREGLTLSAWMDRAARRYALRRAGRRHQEWLDAHPEIRDEIEALCAFARRSRPDWAALGEPA